MAQTPEALLARLDAIAAALRDRDGLALLALGSVADTSRLDRWSDVDFFAIVPPGRKQAFIDDLDWLSAAHPVAWSFRNTPDGHKALFEDGLFAEFAVFEPDELARIPFAPGRIVWSRAGFDTSVCTPVVDVSRDQPGRDWLAGEILSLLFVGLGRWRRGEWTSAFRFIQVYAIDHLFDLMAQIDPAVDGIPADPFNATRRIEWRYPRVASMLPTLMPGVDQCPAAARAILAELARRHPVPAAISEAILNLAAGNMLDAGTGI